MTIRIKMRTLAVTAAVVVVTAAVAVVATLLISNNKDRTPATAEASYSSTESSTEAATTTDGSDRRRDAQIAYNNIVNIANNLKSCEDNGCGSELESIYRNWQIIARYDTALMTTKAYQSWYVAYNKYQVDGCEDGHGGCYMQLLGLNFETSAVLNNVKSRMGWS